MTSTLNKDRVKLIIKSLLFCLVFVGLLILFSRLKSLFPSQSERFVYGIMGTMVVLITTWLFLRFDKKTFRDIGLKWETKTLKRFFYGLAIGIAISSVMILSLISFTSLEFKVVNNYNILSFLLWTLALIPLAFFEEVAFRAYPFINLQKASGPRMAQLVIAILFALYHFIGGQSLESSFIGPGSWSFVFGLAMLMSGGISLPTGLHYGANIVLAAVGQHGQFSSIWTIQHEPGIKPNTEQSLAMTGNLIQLVLFIVTLVIMEWWLRRKKSGKRI